MSEVENNILRRASIRAYTGEDLSGEALIELVEAGLAAPWTYHRHARHLCVISGHENVGKLAAVFSRVLDRPGYTMYAPAAAILVCVERDNDNQKLEVGCVLQNIFLRATDMGIASCWINQARDICDDPRVRPVLRALGVPDTHVCWGIAALGYPAAEPGTNIHREGTYNIFR